MTLTTTTRPARPQSMPPEIFDVATRGLRIDPGLWFARCRDALRSPLITPERRANVNSYGPAMLALARAHKRQRVILPISCWYEQPGLRWATKGPNMHSITKSFGIRDAVIPARGHEFVRGDFTSAHFVIAAALADDRAALSDLLSDDVDPYQRAASIFVPSLAGDKARTGAKICVLSSLNGSGRGPHGIAAALANLGVEVDVDEAIGRRDEWFSRYPKIQALVADPPERWQLPSGRVVEPDLGAGRAGLLWQSYEAEALLLALQRCRFEASFVFYDEILLEVPHAYTREARADLASAMAGALIEAVGLPQVAPARLVKVSARPSWSGVRPEVSPEDPGPDELLSGRRRIVLSARADLDESAALVALSRLPSTFQNKGQIVTIRPGRRDDEETGLHVHTPASLRSQLSKAADFYQVKTTKDGNQLTRAKPSKDFASGLVEAMDLHPLRALAGLTTLPRLRPDGRVVCEQGYDDESGLWYAGPSVDLVEEPTQADAQKAAGALLDVVRDFPFQADADRSAWLAYILSLVMRPLIKGPVPLFCATANQPRVGKSRLIGLGALIATGSIPPSTVLQTWSEAEWEKGVSTEAIKALDAVLIDNAPEGTAIGCPTMDSLLTSRSTAIRTFGATSSEVVACQTVWAVTSNGAAFRSDTALRTLMIRLFWPDPKPEDRTFEILDPEAFVEDQKVALLGHALTIARAWILAGRPMAAVRPWGSFEAWGPIVRSALIFAGLPDPCDTRSGIAARDETADAHDGLMDLIVSLFEGSECWCTRELADAVLQGGSPRDMTRDARDALLCRGWTRGAAQALFKELGLWKGDEVNRRSLGRWIKGAVGRPSSQGYTYRLLPDLHPTHRTRAFQVVAPVGSAS